LDHTVCFGLLQDDIRLTPTSYIVLGLLAWAEPATPYELKRRIEDSVGNFWSLPHAQVYSEPARLAAAGLLTEEQEASGRRRKLYARTAAGRRALEEWVAEPTAELTELRDPGLLKLFFGADPAALANEQLAAHEAQLSRYEAISQRPGRAMPSGPKLALEAGMAHEREWVRFWRGLADD
jgi:PadR family transcriptional regulator AphA